MDKITPTNPFLGWKEKKKNNIKLFFSHWKEENGYLRIYQKCSIGLQAYEWEAYCTWLTDRCAGKGTEGQST